MKRILLLLLFLLNSCLPLNKQIIRNNIIGQVLDTNNRPIENIKIIFYNDGKRFGFRPEPLESDYNGNFKIEKIKVKGDYRHARLMQETLPKKIIFSNEKYVSDTISIADYILKSKGTSDSILIKIILKSKK